MNDSPKRFEEWEEVDCNNCAHYWDDSCEGSHKAQKRLCTSFLATRKVVIPQQIKSLQNAIFWLIAWVALLSVLLLLHILLGG